MKTINTAREGNTAEVGRKVRPRIVLTYHADVGCWMCRDGMAWTVSCSAKCIAAVRAAPKDNRCSICSKRFKDTHCRDMHMLNDCKRR